MYIAPEMEAVNIGPADYLLGVSIPKGEGTPPTEAEAPGMMSGLDGMDDYDADN
ncbi:MAG: hypothetical protein J6I31_01100 [Prevotella sp.]|nr:hypothetical protein [Prevotella sp.]